MSTTWRWADWVQLFRDKGHLPQEAYDGQMTITCEKCGTTWTLNYLPINWRFFWDLPDCDGEP